MLTRAVLEGNWGDGPCRGSTLEKEGRRDTAGGRERIKNESDMQIQQATAEERETPTSARLGGILITRHIKENVRIQNGKGSDETEKGSTKHGSQER